MLRILPHVLAVAVGIAVTAAPLVLAADAPGSEKLSQALSQLASSNGFDLRGLDKIGDETVQPPKAGAPVQMLRKMLAGYAYTVEFAAADPSGPAGRKLARVNILGHGTATAGDTPQTTVPASAATAEASQATAADGSAPVHPVNQMLQNLARTTLPVIPATGDPSASVSATAIQPGASVGVGGAPSTGAAASAGASSPATPAAANPASGTPDMAALTQQASANVSALVQSLKSACPAGAKC